MANSALKPLLAHVLQAVSVTRPLFVALQGPQGSGKSYHSALLVEELRSRKLNVALLSLDDIYLPHAELKSLADTHPDNALWRGRGQPGTHDVPLGIQVLTDLREGKPVEIPRFEKSLFDGEGDRLAAGSEGAVVVRPPVDVVVFEGWCVGFGPVSSAEIDAQWDGAWATERKRLGIGESVRKQDVLDVNEALKEYIPLWNFFDVFVQLQPSPSAGQSPLSVVYKWRLEQEHHMKARNGGLGMSDAGVKAFVDRYIPGYVFFGDGPSVGFDSQKPRWLGKSLGIRLDDNRIVVGTETF
ncbi:P-loop containing nucleoside triphosphate hydrolase protein [Mycena alexandri]|uniref:P-loop containing nucleoside triphosphate hydrolase protein n=1 Tax=Mycena alexandri TaxID=1745969 RepID=A0AAD6T4H4_9AGAR|nr:P-loop containing nucleoside triphosphate hydrolase protein [Mycena alexandri]